jgi:hypothetical protein
MAGSIKRHVPRSSWGSPGAWVCFIGCISIIGLGAALRLRTLDFVFAVAWFSFLFFGSFLFLWRAWKNPGKPIPLGQAAVFPPSWRKWLFGSTARGRFKE